MMFCKRLNTVGPVLVIPVLFCKNNQDQCCLTREALKVTYQDSGETKREIFFLKIRLVPVSHQPVATSQLCRRLIQARSNNFWGTPRIEPMASDLCAMQPPYDGTLSVPGFPSTTPGWSSRVSKAGGRSSCRPTSQSPRSPSQTFG